MSEHSFIQSMRWYGPDDIVPLNHIRQAGCTGVVTALHDISIGEVWDIESIKQRKKIIEDANLTWSAVESLPVHESIKTRSEDFQRYIENYKQSLTNLADCGINIITYNFMPILDWLRTDVSYALEDGSEALYFNKMDYSLFDIYILKRHGAVKDYTDQQLSTLEEYWNKTGDKKKESLYRNMLLGLPGSTDPFTPEEVLNKLEAYKEIDNKKLKEHLILFLQEITPTADKVGALLAIHPDDPPYSVLGLPRIMSCEQDISDIMETVPNASNGLCFCTGSYGARLDNNLELMIKKWGHKVNFFHLRNTSRDQHGNFYEANHLEGDTNLYVIIKEAVHIMQKYTKSIPMRPDHGHKMLDDLSKTTYPGYSAIGRLRGLAELRGIEYAVRQEMSLSTEY